MANKENTKNLLDLISLIFDAVKTKLTEKEKELLFSKITSEQISDEQKKDIGKIYSNMTEGYFTLAISGYQFTSLDKIKDEFGKSLKENYPEASKSFLEFANTYWTFQIHLRSEKFNNSRDYVAYSLLSELERAIAAFFFPTPGLVTIPSSEREKAQREVLKDFDIDIEDFIKGNPILIRDRQKGMFILIPVILFLIVIYYFFFC